MVAETPVVTRPGWVLTFIFFPLIPTASFITASAETSFCIFSISALRFCAAAIAATTALDACC